jgi:hypothetical protein
MRAVAPFSRPGRRTASLATFNGLGANSPRTKRNKMSGLSAGGLGHGQMPLLAKRDQKFESRSLQRRVQCESDFRGRNLLRIGEERRATCAAVRRRISWRDELRDNLTLPRRTPHRRGWRDIPRRHDRPRSAANPRGPRRDCGHWRQTPTEAVPLLRPLPGGSLTVEQVR